MYKPYMPTIIIRISNFQNGLNYPFSSTVFYFFQSEVVEGSHEM